MMMMIMATMIVMMMTATMMTVMMIWFDTPRWWLHSWCSCNARGNEKIL